MKWFRIYYRGGKIYEGPPELAPKKAVQIVLMESRYHVLELHDSADYFVWKDERWYPATADAMWFYLAGPGVKIVLFGEYIDDDEFNEIKVKAIHDKAKSPHKLERGNR